MGDAEKWSPTPSTQGKRIMGFGHRVYRAEDPRSRILKRAGELDAPQIDVAKRLEEVALAKLQERRTRAGAANECRVLLGGSARRGEIPPPLAPAMFACSRVAGWSAHILEQMRTGRLFRPSAATWGRPRSLRPSEPHVAELTLDQAAMLAEEYVARAGRRARRAAPRVGRRDRGRCAPRRLPRALGAYRSIASFAPPEAQGSCGAVSTTRAPACAARR